VIDEEWLCFVDRRPIPAERTHSTASKGLWAKASDAVFVGCGAPRGRTSTFQGVSRIGQATSISHRNGGEKFRRQYLVDRPASVCGRRNTAMGRMPKRRVA